MELYGHHRCCCQCQGCATREPMLEGIVRIKPEVSYNNNRFHPNGAKAPDGIEIRFGATRPTPEVRDMLKAHGFKFSEKQTMWYARDNAKSRELIQFLDSNEIDADDTQYEKRYLWAKVGSRDFFDKLTNYTEFMIKGTPSTFFRTKAQLLKQVSNPTALIYSGTLKFKKFYNKVVGEEGEEAENSEETESEENLPDNDSDSDEDNEYAEAGSEENGEDSNEEQTATRPNGNYTNAHLVIADRLELLAAGMSKQIDQKINSATSKQNPTPKRLRVAAGMRAEGYELMKVQRLLYALAQAHRTGIIADHTLLANIRSKAQAALVCQYEDAFGVEKKEDWLRQIYQSHKSEFGALGIDSFQNWMLANYHRKQLLERVSDVGQQPDPNAEKVKQLEAKIKSLKIPGFFPTPPDLLKRLLKWAQVRRSDAVLEPSAGKGDILDAIAALYPGTPLDLDAIEISPYLREILDLKGYNVIANDFLSYEGTAYDKIVMNPPFENGLDTEHVMHAYGLLKHGGRLTAIVSEGPFFRQFKKDVAFREFLAEKNAYVSEPIKGAFKTAFNQTGVNVRIVVINDDGSHPEIEEEEEDSPEPEESEDVDMLELQAQAEIEIMQLQLDLEKKRHGLNGLDGTSKKRKQDLKQKAADLDLVALWKFN